MGIQEEVSDKQVDVTVATKNSARTLDKCLTAIRENIPVNQLVVVDAGSQDETLEIAKKHNAVIVTEPGLLGRVRYVQAQHCETDWIAYVDSDVYVYASWWLQVSRFMHDKRVGMVLGLGDSREDARLPIYEVYLKHLARKFGSEAFSNTLVKRKLLLSCRGLLTVHAGEDSFFARHLNRLQQRIVTLPSRLCYHDTDTFSDHPSAFCRVGQSSRLQGVHGLWNLVKVFKNNCRNWLIFTCETKQVNVLLFGYLMYLWVWMVVGFCGVDLKR